MDGWIDVKCRVRRLYFVKWGDCGAGSMEMGRGKGRKVAFSHCNIWTPDGWVCGA